MYKLDEVKAIVESILGEEKIFPHKVGAYVRISDFPKREKIEFIVTDLWEYQFGVTSYRVNHSLKLPKNPKRRRKRKQIPYIEKAWKQIHDIFKNPDAIAIYRGGVGLVYAKKIEDKYVLFAVNVKARVIDTAFVKSSLKDTPNYSYIYKREDT